MSATPFPGGPPRRTLRLGPKSVRAKVVCLLMVPVVSLMALWGWATVGTASRIADVQRLRDVNAALLTPVSRVTRAVQAERTATLRALASPTGGHRDAAAAAGRATDRAAAALRRGVESTSADTGALDAALPARVDRLLGTLRSVRDRRPAHPDGNARSAYLAYGTAVTRAFAVRSALASVQVDGVTSDAASVLALARSREALAQETALIAHGTSAWAGAEFVGAAHTRRALLAPAVDDLRPGDTAAYRAVLDGAAATRLTAAEDAVAASGGAAIAGRATASWAADADDVLGRLAAAEDRASTGAAASVRPYSAAVLGGSGLAVGLGLLGALVSLLLSVRIGRDLVTELVELRDRAFGVAGRRLPEAMRRLHAGEDVDVDREAPPAGGAADSGEIAQVGSALTAVHRAALKAAAERAELLSGISGVYVSLARRSQTLLHRQLDLLDAMERRTENPDLLQDLFRVDHLTTRMRRHSESLLILSGASPGRGWSRPVPLSDVIRAAAAEIEDLARVETAELPAQYLSGPAVTDVVHLLAELTENAAQFSPPTTPVTVRGYDTGSGIVLEIEDHGLGMTDEALAAANARIAADGVDLLDTRQLGLFVVNRLARRQHVDVTLRHSPHGGVTAMVALPYALLYEHESTSPDAALRRRARFTPPPPPLPPQPPQPRELPAPTPRHAAPAPTEDALPRRTRFTHLAPELLTGTEPETVAGAGAGTSAGADAGAPPTDRPTPADTPAPLPPRTPESARATLAALHSGRRRAQETRKGTPQ
ncbi:nitrate- and nitrite sensing domain-containing protein [Streptomyces sp. NPDC050400]|uniref:sensor histidine kinase n=1 Tax=Streptomyces sp. NPDC050400 TaxID=3365610 RepID=UPI0037898735